MGHSITSSSQHDPNRDATVLLSRLVETLLLSEWFVACHSIHLSIGLVPDISPQPLGEPRGPLRRAAIDHLE